jgi:toxin CcdB
VAQFDVHANIVRNRTAIPFLLVLQSARFDASRKRVVAPLLEVVAVPPPSSELMPVFTVAGRRVVLDPFQIASIPTEMLGPRVATLAEDGPAAEIQRALDELFSRAFG